MATRNFYVTISRIFGPYQRSLKYALIAVWLGGFALLGVISQLDNKTAFVVLGKLWFSTCAVLGVAYGCTHWFNPRRDPLHSSPGESWAVAVVNLTLVFAVWVWFWED
jgi:uncharacterized membrane protein HdeD (DUF308 family)